MHHYLSIQMMIVLNNILGRFQKNGRPRRVGDAIIQHIFPVEGIDVVTLTVVDVNGCTQAVTDTVDVFTIQPTFEFDKEPICFPSEVTFADMTTSDTTIVRVELFGGSPWSR